jgi:hypothetical protein
VAVPIAAPVAAEPAFANSNGTAAAIGSPVTAYPLSSVPP